MSTIHLNASADTWWRQAQCDLRAAEHLLQGGFARHAAVLAHLAVEKALKAVYRHQHEAPPPASHDVIYLAEQIAWPEENAVHDRARMLDALGDHGVVALYTDQAFGPGVPNDATARARLADAHMLIQALAPALA